MGDLFSSQKQLLFNALVYVPTFDKRSTCSRYFSSADEITRIWKFFNREAIYIHCLFVHVRCYIQTENFPFLEIERGVRIEALELCMKFFSNVLLLVIPCIHKDCILIGKLQS